MSELAAERLDLLEGIPFQTQNSGGETIANAKIIPRIYAVLDGLSIPIPIICTPAEMVEDDPRDSNI